MLEQIVTTTATVADTVEESFVRYYDLFMPSLKYIMANAVSKEHRLLRGKTIECISLIGLAVGQEKVSVALQRPIEFLCIIMTILVKLYWYWYTFMCTKSVSVLIISYLYTPASDLLCLVCVVHARCPGRDGYACEGAE